MSGQTDEQKSPGANRGRWAGGASVKLTPVVHAECTTVPGTGQEHGGGTPAHAQAGDGGSAARRPLDKEYILTQGGVRRPFHLQVYRRDVRIYRPMGKTSHAHKRGACQGMTRKVTKRLRDLLRNLPDPVAMIVFTYPGEYPRDKSVCDRHRKRIMEALRRSPWARGMGFYGIWRRERQRRGAAHWHVLVYSGESSNGQVVTLGRGSWEMLRDYLRKRWYEVVGSGDPEHLKGGVHLSEVRDTNRVVSYTVGEMCKADQGNLPEGWKSWGRQWGKWGKVPKCEPKFVLQDRPAVEGARIAFRARRAKRRTWGKAKGRFAWNGGGATVYDTARIVSGWSVRMSDVTTADRRLAGQARPSLGGRAGDAGESGRRGRLTGKDGG